jgi:regulator of sirC expression with transglutaminase-like and TPR domain
MAGKAMMDKLAHIGLLDDDEILLDEAALLLSAADWPGVNIGPVRHELARMAQSLVENGECTNSHMQALRLANVIAHEAGMTGETDDYDNPANADMLALFERRRGLPVMLSILYVALARRVGWQAVPINFPGHVLVRIGSDVDPLLIDPFAMGTILSPERLVKLTPIPARSPIRANNLQPLSNRATLVRLLMNQASRAQLAGDLDRALTLYQMMTRIAPGFSGLWWEQARLEQTLGRPKAARSSLAAMLETTVDPATHQRIIAAMAILAKS